LCVLGAGRALFAKNSDRPRDEVQVVETHAARAPGARLRTTHIEIDDAGAHALLGSRPTWGWGFEHGVNEHRVAIGNERIFTVDDPRAAPPALTGMDLVRLALERAATADEAIDVISALLEQHGQGGRCSEHEDDPYWSSFLVTDPARAWVLETSGRRWAARPVEDGAAISNRVTLGRDWTRASADLPPGTDLTGWIDPAVDIERADVRLSATSACVATGGTALAPADLVATLRHHGHRPWGAPGGDPTIVDPPPYGRTEGSDGASVCWHVRGVMSTTSAIIAELPIDRTVPLRAWVALGSPCASVFVPVHPFDAGVPPELARPNTWQRFALLRDRAESSDDALMGIRSVLGPMEEQLWEEQPADPWPRVDAALTSLGV
jgi:dipeptidase